MNGRRFYKAFLTMETLFYRPRIQGQCLFKKVLSSVFAKSYHKIILLTQLKRREKVSVLSYDSINK